VVYRDGKGGTSYIKRFNVTSVTRDREYDLTQGKPGSRVLYFTANPNGEAEVIKVILKPNPKLKRVFFDKDFSELAIKGRQSMGNVLTKLDVSRITLKIHGASTLGGRKVWYDPDVKRLNYDEQGTFLGEFNSGDQILVILSSGDFYLTNFDLNNHFEDNLLRLEKYDANKVWTVALFDQDQSGFLYVKRFRMEATARRQNFLGENPANEMLVLTDVHYPRLKVTMGGNDSFRDPIELEAEEFISVKSFKARGKRVTTNNVAKVEELEPTKTFSPTLPPEGEGGPEEGEAEETPLEDEESIDLYEGKSQQDVADEMNGQLHLFDD
jgi:topoisomerase-4 subunit A